MENRLTKALSLGDIDSVPEYERITAAILEDNLLFRRVVELLVAERGADAIQGMHRLEIEAFRTRIGFIRKHPTLRVEWAWLPKYQTATSKEPMVRMRRYFGDSKNFEEQAFWRPTPEMSVAQFSAMSWYNSRPPQEVVAAFAAWLNSPTDEAAAELRHQELMNAESAQKKQGTLTGEVGAAVYSQPGALIDPAKLTPKATTDPDLDQLLKQADKVIAKLEGRSE